MKKLTLLTLLTFSISMGSYAQDPSRRNGKMENERSEICFLVKFNFSDPTEIILPKKIRINDFYKVQVTSVNLNNYRVEMGIKDTVYYSKALDFPVFGSIDITSLSNLMGSFDFFESSSVISNQMVETLKATNFKAFSLPAQIDTVVLNLEKIKSVLTAEQKALQGFQIRLDSTNKVIDTLNFDFMEARVLAKSLELQQWPKIDIKDKLRKFSSLRDSLISLETDVKAAQKSYKEFFDLPNTVILLKEVRGEDSIRIFREKKKVEDSQIELNKKVGEIKSYVSTTAVEKALITVHQLYNSTTYTSLPIQFTGEEAEVKMSFIPKDSTSNLQTYHLSPIKFGKSPWYWAVGPGMYYSKLRSDLVGYETIQVNDSTQNFKVLKEDPMQGEIGISALFHAGYKLPIFSEFIGVHGSVGTGVSLGEEIKARILYGGGIAFGKKNHLTFNIGWATGYVDRVSSSFAEADYGSKLYLEKPSVLVKKLRTEVFYNVGYVFTF
jgi:hypothetical protein